MLRRLVQTWQREFSNSHDPYWTSESAGERKPLEPQNHRRDNREQGRDQGQDEPMIM